MEPQKLNWQQVGEIRRLHATGKYTYQMLGDCYGCSRANIKAIVRHEIWKTAAATTTAA